MHTVVSPATCHHATIRVETERPTAFIDLTERIQALASEAGIQAGLINIQSLHTTTAIVINEHEPLLIEDFEALLHRTAPCDAGYRHDDMAVRTVNVGPGERSNGHAHCRALFLPSSAVINVADGQLQLGRWQRIFLVELDGPQSRDISVMVFG
jgi:secondary thiamine-phosphate synthase enzyme